MLPPSALSLALQSSVKDIQGQLNSGIGKLVCKELRQPEQSVCHELGEVL